MTVLTDKPEVDPIDATLLVEELAEIYITPTPKGWREAKKVKTDFNWCVMSSIQWPGVYIYTLGWHKVLTIHD